MSRASIYTKIKVAMPKPTVFTISLWRISDTSMTAIPLSIPAAKATCLGVRSVLDSVWLKMSPRLIPPNLFCSLHFAESDARKAAYNNVFAEASVVFLHEVADCLVRVLDERLIKQTALCKVFA